MIAASVALTRAWPHIRATNARAVVTIAVKRITAMTEGVRGVRGAKSETGAASRPTTRTWVAARAVAGWRVEYFADNTTCNAKQEAQKTVSASPNVGRESKPPIRRAVPTSASSDAIHARNVARPKKGTMTT